MYVYIYILYDLIIFSTHITCLTPNMGSVIRTGKIYIYIYKHICEDHGEMTTYMNGQYTVLRVYHGLLLFGGVGVGWGGLLFGGVGVG